jgi:hypothetical protein
VLRLHEAQPQFVDSNIEEQFAKYGFDRWWCEFIFVSG